MIIGEADLVIGPLVEKLISGERPKNLAGVLSIYDDLNKSFIPGAQPHNLDILGDIVLDLFENYNEIYQTWQGYRQTGVPLTRGCVWSRCTFCAERFAFRSRTSKNYVDELERIMQTGRPGHFFSSDSDFGGRPELLYEICEEIIRRGLNIGIYGQLRVNKKYNLDFFKLLKSAGFTGLNFGADAFTENMLRKQAKGYKLDTLIKNHEDAYEAGLTPQINIVIGAPGETDQDIVDTINLLKNNSKIFPIIQTINICMMFQNSVYWFEPEKYNIRFHGNKEEIYKKYYFGIPDRLWYSLNPYIDRAIRVNRFIFLVNNLRSTNINLGAEVFASLNLALAGVSYLDYRELMVSYKDIGIERYLDCNTSIQEYTSYHKLPTLLKNRLFINHNGNVLALQDSFEIRTLLKDIGAENNFWEEKKIESDKLISKNLKKQSFTLQVEN